MNKFTLLVIGGLALATQAKSQCDPQTIWPAPWEEASAPGVSYTGYLCQNHDTINSREGWAFYDGDGYQVKFVAGSDITISTYNCTSAPSSLNLADTAGIAIPGIFSAAACPNSLTFTAPYTGIYFISFDSDGDCTNFGSDSIGEVSVKLNNPGTITNCNPIPGPTNDSLCGAIALSINTQISGNTTLAATSDADDANIAAFACSLLNNTLWYSYTPTVTDSVEVLYTSDVAAPFPGWFGFLDAPTGTPCSTFPNYEGCYYGPFNATPTGAAISDPIGGLPTADTVLYHILLTAGNTYYFLIDGVSGSVGAFTFGVHSIVTGIETIQPAKDNSIAINPNPSHGEFVLENNAADKNQVLSVYDSFGKLVISQSITDAKTNLDMSKFAKGVYTATIAGDKTSFTKRIVIN